MKTPFQKVFAPKEVRIAQSKREMERRLRAGGLSRSGAKLAVAAHFRGKGGGKGE